MSMLLVDAHVHIYPDFDVGFLLESAHANFEKAAHRLGVAQKPRQYILAVTEGNRESWMSKRLDALAEQANKRVSIASGWFAETSEHQHGLIVTGGEELRKTIHIVAGKQIVTRENIEVLSLFSRNVPESTMALTETVEWVHRSGAVAILPWGVGKWLGKRGKIIREYLKNHDTSLSYLGDNGSRPWLWPTPKLFTYGTERGCAVLPGSDPLPLPGEAARVGSFGFALAKKEETEEPLSFLHSKLRKGDIAVTPFGALQNIPHFVGNQLRLRLSSSRLKW